MKLRAIFVLLIALSVATLPAAVGFAAASKTVEISASEPMPDCDHHRRNGPSDKTQKTVDDGACMASCAGACFGFTATEFSDIAFSSPLHLTPRFIRTSENISPPTDNLPFRPPRA
jgi:hypothetical protein